MLDRRGEGPADGRPVLGAGLCGCEEVASHRLRGSVPGNVGTLAQVAEKAQKPELALHDCQEALGVLTRQRVFGDDQIMIERVLKGRMQTMLRAHQRANGAGTAVE